MRKILAIMVAGSMLLGLSACGNNSENTVETTQETETAVEETLYEEETVLVDSTSGDYQISAILTVPTTDEKVPLVVMNHGFGGYKDEGNGFVYISRMLAEKGIASIRMDFAGTGDDTRDFTDYTLTSAASDANDCVDYAIENANIDDTKLGIFGYSNGGRIATLMCGMDAQRYQVRVLLAPAVFSDSTDDEANLAECQETGYREMEWFGNTLKVSGDYYESVIDFANNLEEYEQVDIPTLVIRGDNDAMIPEETVTDFVAATDSNLLRIAGADHGYGFYADDEAGYETMDTVAGTTASFFAQYLTDNQAKNMFGEQ